MPSFRRRDAVSDADSVDESPSEPAADAAQARALAEEAEAEAAEAEAAAAAARARARALRLRREAERADEADEAGDHYERETIDADSDVAAETEADAGDSTSEADEAEVPAAPSRWRRLPHPTWKGIAASVVVLCTAALLAGSGYMIREHRQAEKLQQQNAEYAAAARQGVVTLMSLDFNTAQENVQRIIDNSTGQFRDDFEQQAADFVTVAQDSEVVTDVTVNSTAVETMTDESAVVLVAASSRVTNASGANQEPRTWRLSVGLQKEDGQIKMSKVEFVP
ncbi:MAG: hypothetical protein K0U76_05660 [Actinomycetia bacterium]|nr:hypothetical protein [Actinomycetes bacterium]MCH9700864.1 hypothetical protein [Actinomycetes bacterium]MCH9759560.1 hypothetical protein [Actinomycetes bacterium]